MKCLLVSFFNSNNLGDILIGESLHTLASKKYEVETISYSEKILKNEKENNNNNSVMMNNKNNYHKFKIFLKQFNTFKVINSYLYNFKKINLNDFESKIKASDFLLIGGGNMIFDLEKETLSAKRFDKFVSIAKHNKKKVFAISLGIGPFQTKKQEVAAARALSKCDFITFRDKSSYEIFKKYNKKHKNVRVSVDPVFLLPNKMKNNSKEKIIALNIINNKLLGESQEDYDNIIKQYAKLAEGLAYNFNKKVVLFSTEEADYLAVEDVYKIVKKNNNISIFYVKSVPDLMNLYNDTLILIGTRMHAMIVAYTQMIPIIGLSWQEKVDSMFKIIDAKDDFYKYTEIELRLDDIIDKVKIKVENLKNEKKVISFNLEDIIEQFEINETILADLFENIS